MFVQEYPAQGLEPKVHKLYHISTQKINDVPSNKKATPEKKVYPHDLRYIWPPIRALKSPYTNAGLSRERK